MIEPLDYAEIARHEERRQALGTAEVADEVLEVGGGTACFAGVGSWINQAAGLGLQGPVSEAELDALVAFFVERGVEPKVEVAASADPSLVRGLASRGFELREFENVLVRMLPPDEDLWACLPHPLADDVQIERLDVQDAAALRDFVGVTTRGFFGEHEDPAPALLDSATRVAQHPRVDSFSVTVSGTLAAGGNVEVRDEVAALIGAAVLTDYRRRGLQQALIVQRLVRAQELGARFACVHSRPGIATERNAQRLGFRLAYTKVVLAKPGAGLSASP